MSKSKNTVQSSNRATCYFHFDGHCTTKIHKWGCKCARSVCNGFSNEPCVGYWNFKKQGIPPRDRFECTSCAKYKKDLDERRHANQYLIEDKITVERFVEIFNTDKIPLDNVIDYLLKVNKRLKERNDKVRDNGRRANRRRKREYERRNNLEKQIFNIVNEIKPFEHVPDAWKSGYLRGLNEIGDKLKALVGGRLPECKDCKGQLEWKYSQPKHKIVVCRGCDSVFQMEGETIRGKIAASENEHLRNCYKGK